MISWLKKHFIPHAGNDHRPHILRNKNIRNIIFIVLILEVFTFLIPTLIKINRTGGMASVLPAILSDLTNKEREVQKINPLTINPKLNKAAQMKAEDMATSGYFAHTSPSGKTPWFWLKEVGYDYKYAGENLAINFVDSKDVTTAWMNSPSHKANIVKEKYTEIGTGVATGLYEGKETIFVAQVYANPNITENQEKNNPILKTNKNEETKPVVKNEDKTNVLGAETDKVVETSTKLQKNDSVNNPSFLAKIFASPRKTVNFVLFIIFLIISISLLLNIIIKRKHHHGDLVTNGLIVIAIIGAIFSSNYYLTHRGMQTIESFDYSIETSR